MTYDKIVSSKQDNIQRKYNRTNEFNKLEISLMYCTYARLRSDGRKYTMLSKSLKIMS